jgi:hypothetical protein
VFSVEQLARRPLPGSFLPIEIPDTLTGDAAAREFNAAVGRVVAATVRGRGPKGLEPHQMLADAAARLTRSANRPELTPELRGQVAWLVAQRVGHAASEQPPGFDPSSMRPRERWERLLDVLDPARRLTAALGVTIGVDLVGTSLPRVQVIDDRVVPVGRRHRLPPATFDALPVGRWVSVGPYTPDEWLARGELASGNGSFLRLNKTAYIVAVENGDTVTWRLEDIAARTGHGRLATGQSTNLESAHQDVAIALDGRYPALAGATQITAPEPGPLSPAFERGPAQFDYAVALFADSDSYSRQGLASMIGPKLADTDNAEIATADHEQLARITGSAGLTAATTIAVLHADNCPVDVIAALLPTLGVPMSDAIRVLEARWDTPKIEAARMVGANGTEMRAAGCTAAEVLALRPETILRNLPDEPHLWELAAGTMITSGHSTSVVIGHLAEHAPSAETFAAGLVAAIDEPTVGIGISASLRAQPEYIAAASERYGLTPCETAQILRAENARLTQALAVVGHRCNFDDDAVLEAWAGAAIDATVVAVSPAASVRRGVTTIGGTDIGTADELMSVLPAAVRPGAAESPFEFALPRDDIPDLQVERIKS